jgi:hypothetical protein
MLPLFAISQNYVDVLTIGYGQTFDNTFEGTNESTTVSTIDLDFTYPVVLSDAQTLITGITFNKNDLQLFPSAASTGLYSTILKFGLASTWTEKWSTTLVLLPKIASDYENISSNDFYFGGFALLKLKKSEHLTYRFGAYASSEAFGTFTTPIIGWYYMSPSQKFEMDVSLPIAVDINYTFGALTTGLHYIGIGRSFRIDNAGLTGQYVDVSSLDFSAYLQLNLLDNSVLLRGKLGYSSSNYEVYNENEKISLGLSAFSFGDDRTQLNPGLNGSIFAKVEAVYRFQLSTTKTEQ